MQSLCGLPPTYNPLTCVLPCVLAAMHPLLALLPICCLCCFSTDCAQDNVFVTIMVSVQYQVMSGSLYDAFYRVRRWARHTNSNSAGEGGKGASEGGQEGRKEGGRGKGAAHMPPSIQGAQGGTQRVTGLSEVSRLCVCIQSMKSCVIASRHKMEVAVLPLHHDEAAEATVTCWDQLPEPHAADHGLCVFACAAACWLRCSAAWCRHYCLLLPLLLAVDRQSCPDPQLCV